MFGADRIARVRVRGPGEHELRVIIERIREVLQDSDEITPSRPPTYLIDAPRPGAPQQVTATFSPGRAAAAIERLSEL